MRNAPFSYSDITSFIHVKETKQIKNGIYPKNLEWQITFTQSAIQGKYNKLLLKILDVLRHL